MAAHQPPPSLGFSRQEHWSGLPFPSPMHESEKWSRSVAQSCPTLSDLTDCSLPGSSIHGIFQARVLEKAIAFSDITFWKRTKLWGQQKYQWLPEARGEKKMNGKNTGQFANDTILWDIILCNDGNTSLYTFAKPTECTIQRVQPNYMMNFN